MEDTLFGCPAGIAEATRKAHTRARLLARSPSLLVGLCGPSGSGKSHMAQQLHNLRLQRTPEAPLVEVSAAEVPDGHIVSLLQGSVRGGYTDAIERAGLVLRATGGTLYIDEAHLLSESAQVLVHNLRDRGWVRPVGSDIPQAVEVRVILATDQPERLITTLRRRARWVRLPGLEERRCEVPALAEMFISRHWHALAAAECWAVRRVPALTDAARAYVMETEWPDQLHELEGVMGESILHAGGADVDVCHILAARGEAAPQDEGELARLARAHEGELTSGDVSAALGVTRQYAGRLLREAWEAGECGRERESRGYVYRWRG